MKNIMLGAAVLLLTACAGSHEAAQGSEQSLQATALDAPQGVYNSYTFKSSNGQLLPYRLLTPLGYNPGLRYPMIVWLHGSGEMGTNNQQLGNGTEVFTASDNLTKYPVVILVPQCPLSDRWSNMSSAVAPGNLRMSANPTRTAASVFELVAAVKTQLNIDPSRVTLAGLSLGAFGVYDWIARRQDLFTAALPMSGGGDTTQARKLVHTPLWDFHGSSDGVVGVAHSRVMIAAIRAAGGSPKYTEIPGGGHGPWSPIIAQADVLAWLVTGGR